MEVLVWLELFLMFVLMGFCVYLWHLITRILDSLNDVVAAQKVFSPIIDKIVSRLEDVHDSKESVQRIIEDHQRHEEILNEIKDCLPGA